MLHDVLGLISGSFVGFSLGLIGGGGSILAVPLMIYLVGVPSAHVAIGTSALAVAVSAAANLVSHARIGAVKWRCAAVFAAAGIAGAFAGSSLSKIIDGSKLLALFAMLMLLVAGFMFKRRRTGGDPTVRLSRENLPRLILIGLASGALSGFFGIGGGFLIVPGLMFASGMPIVNAIGSSLVAVTAFGATAALNYATSGLVDWRLALTFIAGGVLGGLVGTRLAVTLASMQGALNTVFAGVIVIVAIYMLARTTLA
ncbi:MAG: sulfite exporter TauE/SafE family protein [Bradyrhizobiaceae bacterium]|nr:sulfite exporter TauE/SafE family protein [Bradyrhizobiaceae bacterium]